MWVMTCQSVVASMVGRGLITAGVGLSVLCSSDAMGEVVKSIHGRRVHFQWVVVGRSGSGGSMSNTRVDSKMVSSQVAKRDLNTLELVYRWGEEGGSNIGRGKAKRGPYLA
jgi:hypothetical protein